MADSKRLTILKALSAHLETITVANGYQHDLAGSVYRGRAAFGDDTPLPCLSILEPLNPDRDPRPAGAGIVQKEEWVLLIQGWVDDDEDNPTDPAHNLMADVKKALGQVMRDTYPTANPVYMLGGVIESLRIEPGTVRPPDENSARAYFYLRAVVGVTEDLDDPYRLD